MSIERIHPEGMNRPAAYSHVVVVNGGRLVFVAGQTPVDSDGAVVGIGDFHAQLTQVYKNLGTALAAAGATFADVVKVVQYIPNWDPATHRPVLAELRAAYWPADALPVSTLLGVQSLANPDYLIEIEAIAALP
jgi:enamine deaminase RidA (YjgF/YER057c/UK114 family)